MKPRRKNPARRPTVPDDATGEDIRTLSEGGYDDGDYGENVIAVFGHHDDTRTVEILRGKWVVGTHKHAARNAPSTVAWATFPTRDRAFHHARRSGYTYEAVHGTAPRVRNPDISDAEIRRRVASEASTSRGHRAMSIAHRAEADRAFQRRNRWMADYYVRMADAHESLSYALAALPKRRAR